MHQQARHPPRVSSPASSPQTNPSRTNNPREGLGGHSRTSSDAIRQETAGSPEGGSGPSAGPTKDSIKKLDQIIQNFYYKAAVVAIQSRVRTTPSGGSKRSEGRKTNKWFQLETDDIDDFRDELRTWRTCGSFENRPPPMIIETYLDASRLSPSQSLVIVDDNGKRWDVLEALNSSETSTDSSSPTSGNGRRNTEVVLERWRVELRCSANKDMEDFGAMLPTIYKRSIVFFRSLFVTTRVLPAWKFAQQVFTKGAHPSLAIKCRVLTAETDSNGYDPLRQPLHDGRDVVSDYMFGDLEVPVGRFLASVSYRNDCNIRVDDAESLLSSRFMGVDENFFKPSLPQKRESGRRDSFAEVLPSHRHGRVPEDQQQTYGSLSTFHGGGPLGTSPISALKAVRPIGSDTSSPPESAPASVEQDPPHSLPVGGYAPARRPSLRSNEGMSRRPSVSFQPFKAGSLSGSPRIFDGEPPASPHSLQKQSGFSALAQARNRNSLTAGMAASLRGGPPLGETPVASSPKPSRYSSSFTHRRGRLSYGGASKGDDDQGSSGRQSLASSLAQPGSGLLAEASGGGSSGSFQTDDDNISVFLKELDSRKTLPSFEPGKKGESTAKKTAAQLSKFHLMRESNNALTESMSSSMHLHRSSSSSSRQLTSVPGMVAPASMSSSTSPGKPLSPHTPHTPAIPSRLSENSIIDYQGQAQGARRAARTAPEVSATEEEEGEETQVPVSQEGTVAIDIPLSPRLLQTNRRSSSVAQQHRALIEDDDADLPFAGLRSISLGADEREPPTPNALRSTEQTAEGDPPGLQPAADIRASSVQRSSSSAERDDNPPGGLLASSPYRLRYTGLRGRPTPPQSSRGSFVGSSTAGRYDTSRGENEADYEPLVFDLSELGRDAGRRSLEEGRGGGSAGSGSGERGGFESRGTTRRGWS